MYATHSVWKSRTALLMEEKKNVYLLPWRGLGWLNDLC